jgi:hypothetical protein
MPAFRKTWPSLAAAAAALLIGAGAAHAQSGGGNGGGWGGGNGGNNNCGCGPGGGGHHHRPPSTNITVNINDASNAKSGAAANAQTGADAISAARANATGVGGGWYEEAPAAGVISGLDVDTGEREVKRIAYQTVQKTERRVLIEASCLDDKGAPHPASQVHPERDVADDYDGELFRCIAGTRLQATIGDWNAGPVLAKGETLACDKAQALYHSPGGAVACRAQAPARDCNERSLLRRYGPGVKALKLVREETVTAYREETVERTRVGGALTLDGGVGGYH